MMHPRLNSGRSPRIFQILFQAIFAVSLFIALAAPGLCDPVAPSTARRVAENKIRHHIALYGDWNGSDSPAIADGRPVQYNGRTVAFNFMVEPSGHILVAVDDVLSPILLYSTKSTFVPQRVDEPLTVESWIMPELHHQVQRIDRITSVPAAARSLSTSEAGLRIRQAWNFFTDNTQNLDGSRAVYRQSTGRSATVGPLLTTAWGQAAPYNLQTPEDGCPDDDGHTLTGCVATAWGQVMRYWKWPLQGTGSYSYEWEGQTLSVDFSAAIYNWDNMPAVLDGDSSDAQKNTVSQLLYHVGVAAKMNFGCDASESIAFANDILDEYFRYKESMQLRERIDYSVAANWLALFKNELDSDPPRPVILSIFLQEYAGGHEVVADGYQDDETSMIHINFGWPPGDWHGFYDITTDFEAGGYTWDANSQIIVTGIEPDTDNNSPSATDPPPASSSSGGSSGCFVMTLISG